MKKQLKSSYHVTQSILPVSWEIDYSKYIAFVKVKNLGSGYENTVMVDYRLFSGDTELAEAALNISLMDEVQNSFNDDEKYLDWLAYSMDNDLIKDNSI